MTGGLVRWAAAALLALSCLFAAAGPAAADPPVPTKRVAFLIGVESYRPKADSPAAPTASAASAAMPAPASVSDGGGTATQSRAASALLRFNNLETPCGDVERLSGLLDTAGWNIDEQSADREVFSFCDKPLAAIETQIRNYIYNMDDPGALVIVYLAGHGVEIGGRNYVIGPNAAIDLPHTAGRLRRKARLFGPDALDVDALLSEASAVYNGNLLIIIDTCRDDPVTLGALSKGLAIGTVLSPNIGTRPVGTRIEFATTQGKRIKDGDGSSRVVAALAEDMAPERVIYDALDAMERSVADNTINETPPQNPNSSGNLTKRHWCWGKCKGGPTTTLHLPVNRPSFSGPLPTDGGTARLWRAAWQKNAVPASRATAPASEAATPVSQVAVQDIVNQKMRANRVWRRPEPAAALLPDAPTPIDVVVFWCTGSDQREAAASDLAQRLLALGDGVGIGGGTTSLGVVRTRAFTEEDNARAGYRISRDVIRFDDGSTQEEAVGRTLATLANGLALEPIRARSPDSVSVFLCDGVTPFPVLPRLYVHVPDRKERGVGLALATLVANAMTDLWVAPAVDTVKLYPDVSQVRYFFPEDKERAEDVARIVAKGAGVQPRPVLFSEYGKLHPSARGQIELWLGRDVIEAPQAVAPTPAQNVSPDATAPVPSSSITDGASRDSDRLVLAAAQPRGALR